MVLRLSRRSSLIVADNVVLDGAVVDPASEDPRVHGVRRFLELLAAEPHVSATAIQTVGSMGYDGFALALVTADPWDHHPCRAVDGGIIPLIA